MAKRGNKIPYKLFQVTLKALVCRGGKLLILKDRGQAKGLYLTKLSLCSLLTIVNKLHNEWQAKTNKKKRERSFLFSATYILGSFSEKYYFSENEKSVGRFLLARRLVKRNRPTDYIEEKKFFQRTSSQGMHSKAFREWARVP